MAYKHYSASLKAEAVALATILGAEEGAAQLGISDWRSVRRWSEKAGATPEINADKGTWQRLMDLSIARVTALVAGGKLSPATMATIAGIAARNLHHDPKPEPARDADSVGAAFAARLAELRPDLDEFDLIHALLGELHARERALSTPTDREFEAYIAAMRAAILEGRAGGGNPTLPPRTWREPDDPVGPEDILDEDAFLLGLDLEAWRAMDAERDADYAAMLARRKGLTDALWRELYPPGPSPVQDSYLASTVVAEPWRPQRHSSASTMTSKWRVDLWSEWNQDRDPALRRSREALDFRPMPEPNPPRR